MSAVHFRNLVVGLLALFLVNGCGDSDPQNSESQGSQTEASEVDIKKENAASHPKPGKKEDSAKWQISPYDGPSVITSTTKIEDLITIYGEESIQKSASIPQGEGEAMPGSILFPNDPTKRLEIVWNNAKKQASPFRVIINGHRSQWQLPMGLGAGISLDSLERLNGKPFSLLGFEWDYEGTVVDWGGGRLHALEAPQGGLLVRFKPDYELMQKLVKDERAQILGDHPISSQDSVLKKVQPRIEHMVMEFRGSRNKDFE